MACSNNSASEFQETSFSCTESIESENLLSEYSVDRSQIGNQELVPQKQVINKDISAISCTSVGEPETTLHPAAAAYIAAISRTSVGESETALHPAAAAYLGAISRTAVREPETALTTATAANLGAIPRVSNTSFHINRGPSNQTETVPESVVSTTNSADNQLPAQPRLEVEPRCGLLCRSGPPPTADNPTDNQSRILQICNSCFHTIQTFSRSLRNPELLARCPTCCRRTPEEDPPCQQLK